VSTGRAAPGGVPLELDGEQPVLDEHGLARGGIRTPWVDVPIARTSGIGSEESAMSWIFGSGEWFDAVTVHRLYPGGVADYLERFTVSLDETIQAGFLLAADREEILELAAAVFAEVDS
jgi:hypothetical protein